MDLVDCARAPLWRSPRRRFKEPRKGRSRSVATQEVHSQSNAVVGAPPSPAEQEKRRSPTRIGSTWLAIGVAVVLGICLIDFLAQNTESVRIEFFSAGGRVPVVVALLAAAVAGALVVFVVGVARTSQVRRLVGARGRRVRPVQVADDANASEL